jgi:hypothetical protein
MGVSSRQSFQTISKAALCHLRTWVRGMRQAPCAVAEWQLRPLFYPPGLDTGEEGEQMP